MIHTKVTFADGSSVMLSVPEDIAMSNFVDAARALRGEALPIMRVEFI